jgi:hypothetical protein
MAAKMLLASSWTIFCSKFYCASHPISVGIPVAPRQREASAAGPLDTTTQKGGPEAQFWSFRAQPCTCTKTRDTESL